MDFKSRVKRLESRLQIDMQGIIFQDYISEGFKYKGKPFDSLSDMIKALKVSELPSQYDYSDYIKLSMNKLITFESPEMQEVRLAASEEMKRMM